MTHSNRSPLSARPRSPVLEFLYLPPERNNLLQLIDRKIPEHRLLDEVMRLSFFELDLLPDDEEDEVLRECLDESHLLDDEECFDSGVVSKDTVKEIESECEENICRVFEVLNSRLDKMMEATREMHLELVILEEDLQTGDTLARRLLQETRRLRLDIHAVRFLDDLIYMLRDQLEYITLRPWPFLMANVQDYYGQRHDVNLIV